MIETVTATDADPDRTRAGAYRVAPRMSGAVTAAMIHLGDRLGLSARSLPRTARSRRAA